MAGAALRAMTKCSWAHVCLGDKVSSLCLLELLFDSYSCSSSLTTPALRQVSFSLLQERGVGAAAPLGPVPTPAPQLSRVGAQLSPPQMPRVDSGSQQRHLNSIFIVVHHVQHFS